MRTLLEDAGQVLAIASQPFQPRFDMSHGDQTKIGGEGQEPQTEQ